MINDLINEFILPTRIVAQSDNVKNSNVLLRRRKNGYEQFFAELVDYCY